MHGTAKMCGEVLCDVLLSEEVRYPAQLNCLGEAPWPSPRLLHGQLCTAIAIRITEVKV